MRAIMLRAFGQPAVLEPEDAPDPVAGPGQALIEVAAASVVFVETQVRAGGGPPTHRPDLPMIPGNGVGGVVVGVGAGADAALMGTRVGTTTGGGGATHSSWPWTLTSQCPYPTRSTCWSRPRYSPMGGPRREPSATLRGRGLDPPPPLLGFERRAYQHPRPRRDRGQPDPRLAHCHWFRDRRLGGRLFPPPHVFPRSSDNVWTRLNTTKGGRRSENSQVSQGLLEEPAVQVWRARRCPVSGDPGSLMSLDGSLARFRSTAGGEDAFEVGVVVDDESADASAAAQRMKSYRIGVRVTGS